MPTITQVEGREAKNTHVKFSCEKQVNGNFFLSALHTCFIGSSLNPWSYLKTAQCLYWYLCNLWFKNGCDVFTCVEMIPGCYGTTTHTTSQITMVGYNWVFIFLLQRRRITVCHDLLFSFLCLFQHFIIFDMHHKGRTAVTSEYLKYNHRGHVDKKEKRWLDCPSLLCKLNV